MTKAEVFEHPGLPAIPAYRTTQETSLKVTEPGPPPQHRATTEADRIAHALRTQQTFTRAQVASLIAAGMRWGSESRDEEDRGFWAGYWARVAEENEAGPAPKVFTLGRWYEQSVERERADAAARLSRPNDFPGRNRNIRAAA